MRRMMLGGAVALMTMGSVTTQAVAMDGKDALGILVGAVALGAIAHSINEDRDERRGSATYVHERRREDVFPWRDGRFDRMGRRDMVLPESCLTTFRGQRGLRAALDRRCLRQEGIRVNRLPERCERQVRTRRGLRTVYPLRCLDRHGYRIARHR